MMPEAGPSRPRAQIEEDDDDDMAGGPDAFGDEGEDEGYNEDELNDLQEAIEQSLRSVFPSIPVSVAARLTMLLVPCVEFDQGGKIGSSRSAGPDLHEQGEREAQRDRTGRGSHGRG